MSDTALQVKKLDLKDKREERRHELLKLGIDTTKTAVINPVGIMLLGTIVNQKLYNAGVFNPHDPNHSEAEDWKAGANISDWLFIATMTVAACMAAQAAADVPLSLFDKIF